jgi:hypothetical protein
MIYIAISYTDSAEKSDEKLNVPGSGPILGGDIPPSIGGMFCAPCFLFG